MCGFIASFGQNINHKGLKIAFNQLQRRGPDAEGVWKKDNIFLGSRRLAIFDLHNRSNQPMTSICDRYVLVFNGSIYNYLELRDYLLNSGIKLKTTSDT
jgi:asparagine synthase (glutamine-hydrolysing)